jgi:DNA-binding response OmpR family regulator
MSLSKDFILFALPDEDFRNVITDALKEHGCPFSFEIVTTAREAQNILLQGNVQAIVMTKSIALSGDDGTNGLIMSQVKLPPTITLLNKEDGYPDYLYIPEAFHDWCTMPFDLEELYTRISTVIKRSQRDSRT